MESFQFKHQAQSSIKLRSILNSTSRLIEDALHDSQDKKFRREYRSLNNTITKDLSDNRSPIAVLHVREELRALKSIMEGRSLSRPSSQENRGADQSAALPSLRDRFVPVESILKAHEDEIKKDDGKGPSQRGKKPWKRLFLKSKEGGTSFEKLEDHNHQTSKVNLGGNLKGSQNSLGILFVSNKEGTDQDTLKQRYLKSKKSQGEEAELERKKSIFMQKPIKNTYNVQEHLVKSEKQYADFVKRSKRKGWVKYPPNVILTNLNYFDFYYTVRGHPDKDLLRNDHSNRSIPKDLSTDTPVKESIGDIKSEESKRKEKIKQRVDLRVEKENKDRKKIIRDIRIKQKLIKALSLDQEKGILPDPNTLDVRPPHLVIDTEMTEPLTNNFDNSDDIDSNSISKRQIPDSPLASKSKNAIKLG